ncbi:DUF3820 family protein [Dyadobacter sediminis]|uniref:DUF3820 family protein n=1 Tax=Dyadobacter sediminis TaxID=1493691 RepID=A0A5R9KAF6_9BACT|nr:DUF3820 family protein [Dyadobacter sediminis]TLU91742.1 DUF3820 family protein [Dyadobacter sediminis]GGC00660.1 hypothetical protein GCM10011325_29840 [Dyadobacter sediminis]
MQEILSPDSELLKELIVYKMPFGKYKDSLLTELPITYLEWFQRQGFPSGKLGMMLSTLYEIRLNGLEHLLKGLKKLHSKS